MVEDLFRNPLHLMTLLVVVMLLFGGSRVADLGGSLGKGIHDFKRSMKDDDEATASTAAPLLTAATATTRSCGSCGARNVLAARFCISCGNSLAVPGSPTTAG